MTKEIVVDISVVSGWCFAEAAGVYVDAALEEVARFGALVPMCLMTETANIVLAAERRMRLTEADSTRFLTLFQALPIRVDSESISTSCFFAAVLGLARRYGLNGIEAASLDLALREGARLASLNQRLRQAAQSCHVILYS